MAAKDIFHDALVHSLQNDGWTVTHEPLSLKVGGTDLFVDVGAERFVTAIKGTERIAVEVKSFVRLSAVQDLKEAVGQFVLYEDALSVSPANSDRVLYLGVRQETFDSVFVDDIGQLILQNRRVRLVVFDPDLEVVTRWIP